MVTVNHQRRKDMQDWGFVYVLTNDYMPGVVKIGRTSHAPSKRAKELSGTGVPGEFDVAYAAETSCMVQDEALAHRALDWLRVNDSEFFHCSAGCARRAIENVCQGVGYAILGDPDILDEHPDGECFICMTPKTYYAQRGD